MFFSSKVNKAIASTLLLAQLSLAVQPLMAAVRDDGGAGLPQVQAQTARFHAFQQQMQEAKAQLAVAQASPADQASRRLDRLRAVMQSLTEGQGRAASAADEGASELRALGPQIQISVRAPAMSAEQRRLHQAQMSAWREELRDLLSQVQADEAATREDLARTRQWLLDRKLPGELLARHEQALRQFEQTAAALRLATQSTEAEMLPALTRALAPLDAQRRQPAAPSRSLPWRAPEPNKRQPADTRSAWFQHLLGSRDVRLAQAGSGLDGIHFEVPPEPSEAPVPADLAETPETQLSPALRAKALELGNNPVQIQNWVRNHIEWQPTWGALQSAQDTLDKRRGNAHDIASLQIALLRAAKIPARYQYGTISLPVAQVQNWLGLLAKPEVAQPLLSQGGIASKSVWSAGHIDEVQLEHVWVRAYVNWAPSRGAKAGAASQHVNPVGPLNAWVDIDASYKQYQYSPGLDLKNQVPLDGAALLTAAQQGATVNEAEGWVQNLNQAAIQNQLSSYQNRLKSYIDQQAPNGTVGDVIGRKIVPVFAPPMLAGSLPFRVVFKAQQLSAVPPALQHRFSYRLYASAQDRLDDAPLLSFTEKTSQLVGKRLSLSYVPASQADADLIASYLPKPHADGSPIDPSEFPRSLPAYLIRLKPQIVLDGQVVASTQQGLTMGTPLYGQGGFSQFHDLQQWDLAEDETHSVGNATVFGLSAGGISGAQLNALKLRLEASKTKLQAGDLTGLSGEQITGDLLTATIWSWFAAAESHSRLSQNQAGVVETLGLSYGLFHAQAEPVYSWGLIRKVEFPGVNIDIGHVRLQGWSKNGQAGDWAQYMRLRGQYMSALEHAVPERFFSDRAKCNLAGEPDPKPGLPACPQGISAVKALALAAAQGQRIYTITQKVFQDNPGLVTSHLSAHSWDTRQRVQQALEAGQEVTIHQRPVLQDGWAGAGFVLLDPETGAGRYLIEGGGNGGRLALAFGGALICVTSMFFFGVTILALWSFFWVLAGALAFSDPSQGGSGFDWSAFLDWGGLALSVLTIPGGGLVAILGLIFAIVTVVRNLWIISQGG